MLKATTGWGRRMKGHRPLTRRATAAIAVTALLSLAVIGALPGAAYAGVWMQTSCANPDQSAASSEGWTGGSTGTPSRGSTNNTNCDPSNPMYAGLGNGSPAPSGSGQYLQYTPPAGSRLVGGSLLAGLSADGYGEQAVGAAAMITPAFQYDATNVFLQCVAALYQCQNGTFNYFGVVDIPANRGGNLYLSASCIGQTAAKNCSMGGSHNAWALVSVFYARLLLSADSPPTATEFGGSLLSDGAHGTANLSFTASDTGGPGIHNVTVAIDGTTIYDDTPNTNAGKCAAVGTDAASGALMFASQQPCPQVQRVVVPVSTTRLTDGEHEVTVKLRTAAGNASTVLVQTITTTNRTTVSGELTSDAPPPPAIAAAPEPVYAMVLDAPTQALLRGVKRVFTRSGLTLAGTLRNSAGVPAPGVPLTLLARNAGLGDEQVLARTTSDAAGHWELTAPPGPSRALTITYGSGSSGAITIRQTVTPGLSLRVSALGRGRLRFTGRLSVSPLGSPRPLVVIQARKGKRWQSVGSAVRVKPNGTYTLNYNGGRSIVGGSYVFRATAPSTPLFSTATSATKRKVAR